MRYAAQAMRAAQSEAERKAARDAEILEGAPHNRQLRLLGGLGLPACMLHAATLGYCRDGAILLSSAACGHLPSGPPPGLKLHAVAQQPDGQGSACTGRAAHRRLHPSCAADFRLLHSDVQTWFQQVVLSSVHCYTPA